MCAGSCAAGSKERAMSVSHLVYGGGHMMPFDFTLAQLGQFRKPELVWCTSLERTATICVLWRRPTIHMKLRQIVAPFGGRHAQF